MNGIIHNCAYPRDSDTGPKHRFSKQKIALSIFQYIEKLFDYIKPKKYFFMAVDGDLKNNTHTKHTQLSLFFLNSN